MDLEIKKKEIKTNLIDTLFDDSILLVDYNNNSCEICSGDIDNPINLKCGHSFCYDCLLQSYKGVKCNYNLKSHRICPYCRNPSTFLPLELGNLPIKGIHREYGKKKKIFKKCTTILKSGPRSGESCDCIVKPGMDFCGRHKPKS